MAYKGITYSSFRILYFNLMLKISNLSLSLHINGGEYTYFAGINTDHNIGQFFA